METSVKLYSLPFGNVKTYLFVLLFVAGNIALPQLCHLVPAGGPTLLPIYFFTLIAAYKYGFKVGLLTAILSPVINHLLFAMPAAAVLPAILIKSGLLVGAAALVHAMPRISLYWHCWAWFSPIKLSVRPLNGRCAVISFWLCKISVWAFRAC